MQIDEEIAGLHAYIRILQKHRYKDAPNITGLPNEILRDICHELDKDTIRACFQVASVFLPFARERLFRRLETRDVTNGYRILRQNPDFLGDARHLCGYVREIELMNCLHSSGAQDSSQHACDILDQVIPSLHRVQKVILREPTLMGPPFIAAQLSTVATLFASVSRLDIICNFYQLNLVDALSYFTSLKELMISWDTKHATTLDIQPSSLTSGAENAVLERLDKLTLHGVFKPQTSWLCHLVKRGGIRSLRLSTSFFQSLEQFPAWLSVILEYHGPSLIALSLEFDYKAGKDLVRVVDIISRHCSQLRTLDIDICPQQSVDPMNDFAEALTCNTPGDIYINYENAHRMSNPPPVAALIDRARAITRSGCVGPVELRCCYDVSSMRAYLDDIERDAGSHPILNIDSTGNARTQSHATLSFVLAEDGYRAVYVEIDMTKSTSGKTTVVVSTRCNKRCC